MMVKKIDTIEQNEQRRQKLITSAASAVSVITDMVNKLTNVNDKINEELERIPQQEEALIEIRGQYAATKEQNNKVIERFKSFLEE